jgi:hypothetical protein
LSLLLLLLLRFPGSPLDTRRAVAQVAAAYMHPTSIMQEMRSRIVLAAIY